MFYSKLQKFSSSLLMFSILFGITFRIPFGGIETYAGGDDFYNIVSIIVDENSFDKIEDEIERYSKDIQGVLENTKVIILPTPKEASAFEIASLNEALYYEGYKSLDKNVNFESKLIGTVIVGDFNLPIVFDGESSSKTILPFTDFEDKVYVYNKEKNRYEKNKNNINGLKSEIWHGVISPNFGDFNSNIKGLKDYFDKNHDFYSGTGDFKYSEGVLNGDKKTGVPSIHKPFVFYYDQFRETKALNYNNFKGYEGYIENKEDIVYQRYTKDLADKLSNKVSENGENVIGELLSKVDSSLDISNFSSKPDISNSPDIQTRHIINNVTKNFIEVFAKGTLGDFRKDVHNAGRYNESGSEVNVDFIPYFITVLDLVNDEIIKDVNDTLEDEIDNLVKNGLSKKIAIPVSINSEGEAPTCGSNYINFLYGTQVTDITNASQCSIFKGNNDFGGQLVEQNRGYNFSLAESDGKLFGAAQYLCKSGQEALNGYFGGNTPVNIDTNLAQNGELELKSQNYKNAIKPLFDISGGKKVLDNSLVNSPLNCFDNNLILTKRTSANIFDENPVCRESYSIPINGQNPNNFVCSADNIKLNFNSSFEEFYVNNPVKGGGMISCSEEVTHTKVDDYFSISKIKYSPDLDNICTVESTDTYTFKFISSYITHKSPTVDEIKAQIKGLIAPNLAIDKNRYIDFISAKGDYESIFYPTLFRLNLGDTSDLNFEKVSLELEKTLNEKSKEINDIIIKNNPSSLTGNNKTFYELGKVGEYPEANIDLLKILKEKEEKTFTVGGEEKTLSYYDTLVFSLYWNSLTSVSAKYAFVMDHYLVDQFGNENQKYFLPKNKKQYEISYLGAEGDAQNMFIKMDPEGKADNPYSNIIGQNINLSSLLMGTNIGDSTKSGESVFKCSPPDGVPIQDWIPSIMCWLGEMMPPSISISAGTCGPSLLTAEEQAEIYECNGDVDKNGINDCVETKLDEGKIELSSDSTKYYYNTNAILKASIKDKYGKTVKIDNTTDIYFEVIKIDEPKDITKEFTENNSKSVFDINNEFINDKKIISDYVTFKDAKIRAITGVSEYGITFKNKDLNVYLKAFIKLDNYLGDETIFIESNILELKVRGDRLFSTSYKLINTDNGVEIDNLANGVKVSDKTNIFIIDGFRKNIKDVEKLISNSGNNNENIVISINNIAKGGFKLALSYPLNIKLFNQDEEIKNIEISKNDLNLFKGLFAIKKAGSYSIEITDSTGFKTIKNIELLPENPNNIDVQLGTNVMESGGNVSTNFITIKDKYGNPTIGKYLDINFSVDGNSIEFLDNNSDKLNTSTFEGYKIFRLKSTEKFGNNKINISILNDEAKELITGNTNIKVLKNINLEAKQLINNIKVGGDLYKYEISLKDENGLLINDFNSRVYLIADPIYIDLEKPYVLLKNGKAEIEFRTKKIAGKNIDLEFQVEGLNKIVKKEITIFPEKAMKIDLVLSQNKMEASNLSSSNLTIELKDRYNNLVFNDNTTKTTLEILDKYKHIIVPDKYNSTVIEGESSYQIFGTQNPGVAYFKVSTNPSLSINSFVVEDESGKVIISGIGENVGKIETFYFWNNEKLKGKKYNSIYTTLLGSNYGDITEKNYLAGSLLFERENRALAVTSLLNSSYKYSDIINISKRGAVTKIYPENDLSQDIDITTTFVDNKIALSFFNKSLNTYIGKVLYNFSTNTELLTCEGEINTCVIPEKQSIVLKANSDEYKVYLTDNKLLLRDIYGKNLLEILPDGTINRFGNIDFEINNNFSNFLVFSIKVSGKEVALLGYNFLNKSVDVSRSISLFEQKIKVLKNSILIYLNTNTYSIYNRGNVGEENIVFYYNDPFETEFSLDSFSKNNLDGIENFAKKAGIGWKEGNKALLSFSAGKSVGESVADYMSFSVINLGDPVISLKKIKEKIGSVNIEKKFDSTIGKLVSKDDDIVGYNIFDYNNDSRKDILLIKENKYLKLLENKSIEGSLLDKGNLAYLQDLGNIELIKTGDFTGDGYDDIFFVNKKGEPFLLNNISKNFNRYSLIEDFNLKGRIVRAESFDMDNDNIDDIVTLDDAGEINIFYGNNNSVNPIFTKLTVSNNHGIKLNEEIRNDGSLIYFDGIYQPYNTIGEYSENITLAKKPLETDFEYNSRIKNIATSNKKIDDYLYVKYPYDTREVDVNYEDLLNSVGEIPFNKGSLYFLKSEYSEFYGLQVEKEFKDINGGFISSGDIINVKITLKNISNKDINNIIYSEKLTDIFEFDEKTLELIDGLKAQKGAMGYNFLIDNINLKTNEEIVFGYKAKVRPIKYSYISVGLFEDGEVGDDLYGDIILKDDNKNCSDTVDIFKSIGGNNVRGYSKGTKSPTCNEDKIKLPEELEKNTFDVNNNGVPDYIDKLTGNIDGLKEYASSELDKMNIDSDNDGILDSEDMFNMEGSIIFDLGESGIKIDKALDNVQNIMDGLSCGFGNASCFASPLNWAPLAPGGDPVFMGKTIGDGLKVDEGIPIISGLTGINIPTPGGCYQVPAIWPASPFKFTGSCNTEIQAGGSLGVDSPTNFFRMFVTPTLTGGVGTAICFGGPASVAGVSNPKGFSPLVPGGNCIIVAQKMAGCEGGGLDGDPSSIGMPMYSGNGSFGIINGNCTTKQLNEKTISRELISDYLSETKKGNIEKAFEFLPGAFSEQPKGYLSRGGADISVMLDLDSIEEGNFDDIIQIQQKRISSFPSWLMDWVTRQVEEIANKLTDFPTIFVILPDFTGIFEIEGDDVPNPINLDNRISNFEGANKKLKNVNSGIKEVYEFIASAPLIKIEQETVNISLPIITEAELNASITSRKNTLKQWEAELEKAKENWKDLDENLYLDTFSNIEELMASLRNNLEIIKEYKTIPEDINKLINKKEDYLEQILCNVEAISSTVDGWIGKNAERFKAWVELYILIKAILKSWQGLIDVFVGYEEECYECKNERGNALDEQFSLIDILIPDFPIIKFPKWPDIYMDLHNIRAGLNIYLPEFNIKSKPILLPTLPNLYLPEAPIVGVKLNIKLPTLPTLTRIQIPTLPDLPTLPTVNLPDLPPPPKLPKMFSEIEIVVDIAKLITKAMCILKSSPFHPEWRAGDQIAFLTERSGYLGTDFFSLSGPEFSFPFIDAIKVTSYVNLEFETEFIVELARQIAMPLNSFSNDMTNFLHIPSDSLDFRNSIPKNSDINIENNSVEFGATLKNLKGILAERTFMNINNFSKVLEEGQDDLVGNKEFITLINKSLSSESITSNPKMDNIRKIWETVNNLTYSKENALIKELKDNNREKFITVSDIINTEIIKNKKLKEQIQIIGNPLLLQKVSYNDGSNIEMYNKELYKYNDKFIKSAKKLIDGKQDYYNEDLKEVGNDLISALTPLQKYSSGNKTNNSQKLLSNITNDSPGVDPAINSCQLQAKSDYRYNYEGLYIIQGEYSYRLFDYLDELDGNEITSIVDIDNDRDEDLLYFANNKLYLKTNLEKNPTKNYLSTPALTLKAKDNKFYNGEIFIEAINGFSEKGTDNGNINIGFDSPTDKTINNFKIGLYKYVDKYINETSYNYRPEFVKKEIIDAIVGIDSINKISENELFIKRKNIAYIKNIGNFRGAKLVTKELINIKNNILSNQLVNILKGTSIYSGGDSFTIKYTTSNNSEINSLSVEKYSNIELLQDIKIIGITGNAYIKGANNVVYNGVQVRQHIDKPLFTDSKISYVGNNFELQENSYIEIKYYDNSIFSINFNYINSWELYDLGNISSSYFVRLNRENDYYYSKIYSFKNNINSTISNQILLAPQVEADVIAPELSIPDIKIPVYQKKIIDLSSYIYENGGLGNISEIKIDFDLSVDLDKNGNPKDDNDLNGVLKNKIKVHLDNKSLKLEIGEFETLFKKQIGITIIDNNGNIGYSEIFLEVYSPVPQIELYGNGEVKGSINENLDNEPINLYRFRGGLITQLKNINGEKSSLTKKGSYLFNLNLKSDEGLILYDKGEEIAFINEQTGKITLNKSSLQTEVLSSNNPKNDGAFPKIILKDNGLDIFYQFVQVEGVDKVSIVSDFENINKKGIYFNFTDNNSYNYYIVPETLEYNPGALSIYRNTDVNKESLFTVFKDGRINTINPNYKLEYETYNDYIIFKLIDSHFKREIGRILLITDSEYIMQ